MKRILAVVLVCLVIVSAFIGCSSETGTQRPKEIKQTEGSGSQSADSGEEVELSLYQFQPGIVDQIQEICELYTEQNPNVKITSDRPGDDYFNMLKSMFASDQGPDMFSINAWTMVYDYASAGIALDLSNEPFEGRIAEGAIAGSSYEGKLYALPMELAGLGILYNKTIFEENDLEIPKTVTELENVCKTLENKGIAPFVSPMKEGWIIRHLWSMVHTPSVDILKFTDEMNEGKGSFKNEKTDGIFKVIDMWGEYCQEKPFDYDWNMSCAEFGQGKAAMMATGLWALDMVEQIDPEIKTGMFAIPISDDPKDTKLSVDSNSVYCINSKSENTEESKKFFDWLSSEENAKLYADKTKTIPVIKNVPIFEGAEDVAKDILEYSSKGETCPWGFSIWPTGFDDEVGSVLQTYYTKDLTKEQVIEKLDKSWAEFANK